MTWKPYYWIDALIRVITAVLSVLTALVLWPLIPRLLALPSPSQLRMVNQELQAEVARRQASEAEILALNQVLEQRVAERTSELIQRTQEAEVANRSKSDFLANMSHELRTPLNAIIGYSELMREDIQDHDQDIARQITDLGHVHASATHLLNLINEVLDVSRIEADKIDIIQAPVQALSLLEDVHRTILPLASKNSNQIEVKAGVPDLVFVSDYYRIKQILLNLLSNACKFTHNGLVQLEMAVSDCQACFRVRDNGIGIQPEHIERIFDMFYQADSSYGRKYMGTGLGLTIARSLTEKLGGRLEVESTPGVSTVFSVFLPLDQAPVGEEIMEEAGRR